MRFVIACIILLAVHAVSSPAQEPFGGTVLISVRTSTESFLMDQDFNILHTWHGYSGPATFAYLLPGGSILRPTNAPGVDWGIGGAGGRIQKIDTNDNVVWDYIFADSLRLQHHDIEPMPNGNVLLIAWEKKFAAEATAAGRLSLPIGEMWPTMIAEIEPVGTTGGNIVWEWHLWDHLIQDVDSTKNKYGVLADHPELVDINWPTAANGSFDHADAIDYNPELDQITFCGRAMSEIYVIDHSTTTEEAAGHTGGNSGHGGDILYRWGNPQVYDRGTESDRVLFSVHGGNWIDTGLPGAGNLLIFNNGKHPGPPPDYSSVVEIHPPTDGHGNYLIYPGQPFGPAEPTWVYEDRPNFYSENKGSAYRLPNGNTLICESNDNNLFEVTRSGQKVWGYLTPGELHRAPPYWTDPTGIPKSAAFGARLRQNYPNPFNPQTTILYSIRVRGYVSIRIYNATGGLVRTLVGEVQDPRDGDYSVVWDGRSDAGSLVPSGVYFCRLAAGSYSDTKKMVVLR